MPYLPAHGNYALYNVAQTSTFVDGASYQGPLMQLREVDFSVTESRKQGLTALNNIVGAERTGFDLFFRTPSRFGTTEVLLAASDASYRRILGRLRSILTYNAPKQDRVYGAKEDKIEQQAYYDVTKSWPEELLAFEQYVLRSNSYITGPTFERIYDLQWKDGMASVTLHTNSSLSVDTDAMNQLFADAKTYAAIDKPTAADAKTLLTSIDSLGPKIDGSATTVPPTSKLTAGAPAWLKRIANGFIKALPTIERTVSYIMTIGEAAALLVAEESESEFCF